MSQAPARLTERTSLRISLYGLIALSGAALSACSTTGPQAAAETWPSSVYVNPQVTLPEKFSFVGDSGDGSKTMVVGHGFFSSVVTTDTPPEQSRLQMLYDHNRKVIASSLVSRFKQELASSKRYQLADDRDTAQGELRIDVRDVGIAPADSSEDVIPYFRAEMSLFDKAGNRLWREDVSMPNAAQLQTEKAALLGDINGLRNFYDDGMRGLAQRALADLSTQP